ncbi:MAG: hypothetical protein LBH14_05455, partial [Desulfobulbaceae bacterium]|nr:hypothetical protein [Desulfobulbaceae bacterium]
RERSEAGSNPCPGKIEKWIASATLRSRQAYFAPRNDADHYVVARRGSIAPWRSSVFWQSSVFWIASSLRSSQRQGREMVVVATANEVKREATHVLEKLKNGLFPPRFARGRLTSFLAKTGAGNACRCDHERSEAGSNPCPGKIEKWIASSLRSSQRQGRVSNLSRFVGIADCP